MENLKELYMSYLLSSTCQVTSTGLSAVLEGEVSHDKITRFLSKGKYDSKSLWKQSKSVIKEISSSQHVSVLSIDDCIQQKPHTKESSLNCWHYDHCSGRSVKGVQFLNALYTAAGTSVPICTELIKKDTWKIDSKTGKQKRVSSKSKNALFREMVTQCSQNIHVDYLLGDRWFSSTENIKHVFGCNMPFIMGIKSNRLLALSAKDKEQGKWISIKSLDLEQGCLEVWLKGLDFPLLLSKQVFKNGGHTAALYLICSDLSLSFDQIAALYKKRWSVEQFHKALKQVASFGKSPTKTIKTQSNHFYLSIMAFNRLEILKIRAKSNEYALKQKIYTKALMVAMKEIMTLSTSKHNIAA